MQRICFFTLIKERRTCKDLNKKNRYNEQHMNIQPLDNNFERKPFKQKNPTFQGTIKCITQELMNDYNALHSLCPLNRSVEQHTHY